MTNVGVLIPSISLEEVEKFSKVWNRGGITILLDNTAKEFAKDFANIVLKSFILDQMKKAMQQRAMQAPQGETALPPTPPATVNKTISSEGTAVPTPRPGSIVLTD